MIIGIGTDIVQIERIEKIFAKYGDYFKKRILSNSEIEACDSLKSHNRSRFLAKRFAAKEAVSKALGTGIRGKLAFRDIVISNDEVGKPVAHVAPDKLVNFGDANLQIDLSIADDYPVAIAFSVISKISNYN